LRTLDSNLSNFNCHASWIEPGPRLTMWLRCLKINPPLGVNFTFFDPQSIFVDHKIFCGHHKKFCGSPVDTKKFFVVHLWTPKKYLWFTCGHQTFGSKKTIFLKFLENGGESKETSGDLNWSPLRPYLRVFW
jgi:hypothetical protein